MKSIAVAIDGPAGSGKSSIAKSLAKRLNWQFIDTGAMYRATTLKASRQGISFDDSAAIAGVARSAEITLTKDEAGLSQVLLDNEDVTSEIRAPELTALVKKVACCGEAREVLVGKQQEMAKKGKVVMEGRDIGSVVLPDAMAKFYLDATVEERARRRAGDLTSSGKPMDMDKLIAAIEERDRSDRERKDGPLIVADGAEVIDTTEMSEAEVLDTLFNKTNALLAENE